MDVRTGPGQIRDYLSDESQLFKAEEEKVEAIYFPETEEDVISILKKANEEKKPVSVSGAGTGITGSRVPMQGGLVVSMEKFLKIRPRENTETFQGLAGEILFTVNCDEMSATVPPGMTLSDLARALTHDLFYPPDPTEQSAQLGGTLATNASGAKSYNYGPTRDWVKAIRMVLADGEVLTLRRNRIFADENGIINLESGNGQQYSISIPKYQMPALKNAAGLYSKPGMDAVDLFIGSEGIFGVITEVEIRLASKPRSPISDIAFFDSEEKAIAFVNELRQLREGVLSIEFFNKTSLDFIRAEFKAIKELAAAAVFLELEDSGELMGQLADMLDKYEYIEDWCALNRLDMQDLKEFRHALPDNVNSYLKQHRSYKLGTDFVVPPDRFPEMMRIYRETGEKFRASHPRDGVHYVIFGHIGDSHVHFNFLSQSEAEQATAKALYAELAKKAIEFGGTISGEHGVGKKRLTVDGREIPYLELMYGKAGLQDIAGIKKVFDPNLILNVGNMLPVEYLD